MTEQDHKKDFYEDTATSKTWGNYNSGRDIWEVITKIQSM